ncbi:MAG: ABC transporter ATP-binding protein/permease [Spirochaetales bacterium]|nr:ABC transporter ATP-binding protein/permease [Spirochaetales bacterium]
MLKEYKTLLPLVKRYTAYYVLGLLALVLTNAGELYIPQLIKQATNLIAGGDFSLDAMGRLVLMMAGIAALVAFFRFGWRYFIHGASRRIERDLREKVFQHLLSLSSSFYQKMRTGDIMARSSNDMRAVRMASGMALVAFIDGIFLSVAILIILFTQFPKLALITIIPLPFITVIVLLGGKVIGRRFKAVQEGFSRLSEYVQETLTGIRVVKSFVKESWAERNFNIRNDDNLSRNMQLVRIWGLFFPLITFISGLSMLFLLYFGGQAVIMNEFTPGDFMAFMSYLTMLRWPVMGLGFTINMLQRGAASLERINEILNEEPEITSGPKAIERSPAGGLKVEGLSFSYQEEGPPILQDISFEVPQGTSLGILGRTGSGKSTLVRLIPRLLDPPAGTIFIGDDDIRDFQLPELRAAIGIVPQDSFLFSADIRDNIAFGQPDSSDEEVQRAAEVSTISRELETFPHGWNTEVGERGVTLSGGQKQRIAISRAMMIDPELLIFDDALASVDAETEEKILGAFLKVRRGRTNVLVAHRVSTLRHADHIIVLDGGRIVQQGSHTDLAETPGLYQDIYRLQQCCEGGV